jgi:uncharacterized delta-60 repeat protein
MKNKIINSAFIFTAIGLTILSVFAASPGSLDSGFGLAGKTVTNAGGDDVIEAVATQKDGGIVVVGGREDSQNVTIVAARYLANGKPDTTFDLDGLVTTQVNTSPVNIARSVVIQSDGKILLCGETFSSTGQVGGLLVRYNFNGSLDTTFDNDGMKTLNNSSCRSLAVQPDGKIIGAGSAGNLEPAMFRLTQSGSVDTTFGTNGFVSAGISGANNIFLKVKLRQDGKIVALANVNNENDSKFFRYNTNGTLDTTFSSTLPDFRMLDFAIDPADQLVTAVGTSSGLLVVIRLRSNGVTDINFQSNGIVNMFLGNPPPNQTSILIQSDRKLLIAATTVGAANRKISLVRLNQNGLRDTSFGLTNGVATNQALLSSGNAAIAFTGDLLILGTCIGSGFERDFQITRHNLSNTPTATSDFDGDGVTDSAVFRPSTRDWFILRSTDNTTVAFQFGLTGDVPIDGDFDGDGRNDLAVFRPSSGEWFFLRSSDGTTLATQFGQTGDKPVPGDYDKDGKTDIAFFRPSNANWFILKSSTKFVSFNSFQFGSTGDIPLSSEQK